MAAIEWHRGFADSPGARLAAYVLVGSAFSVALLITVAAGALLVLLVVEALLSGSLALALAVVVLALVGGPASLLYLWPLLTDADQRRGLGLGSWLGELPRRNLVAATLMGVAVHLSLLWLLPPGILGVVAVVVVVVGVLGTGLLLTEGQVDPDERTLTVRPTQGARETSGTTVDLDAWTDLGEYRLGPVTFLRPSYAPGASRGQPRLLAIPAWVAEEAAPVFTKAIEAPPPEAGRDPNPAVAATLGLFGLGFGVVAAAVWIVDAVPDGFKLWTTAVFGLFGTVFFVAAMRER